MATHLFEVYCVIAQRAVSFLFLLYLFSFFVNEFRTRIPEIIKSFIFAT